MFSAPPPFQRFQLIAPTLVVPVVGWIHGVLFAVTWMEHEYNNFQKLHVQNKARI